ncbi:MAG: SAM-dependent chlorinase/fluorinase, partial [Candidatus Acidiferrum sp.]
MTSRVRFLLLPVLALTLAAACSKDRAQNGSSASPSGKRPTIVFVTDFGTANDAVAICKAVIMGIAPDVRIMDITHQ